MCIVEEKECGGTSRDRVARRPISGVWLDLGICPMHDAVGARGSTQQLLKIDPIISP